MAAYYRTCGISLIEARERMYKKYGVYKHMLKSFTCEGITGMERMKEIMTSLRTNPPACVGGLSLVEFSDYAASETKNIKTGETTAITLPKSDVLVFTLENNATIIIRPSGTEPKIKVYYTTTGNTQEEATALYEKLDGDFRKVLGF